MDSMEAILTRRSIRRFTSNPIPDKIVKQILIAAMAAPSAGDQQPWQFVVINDRAVLNKIPEFHPYSQMLLEAPLAILVCGDIERQKHIGYWVQDCSTATQNILLATHSLGWGAVWLGIHPREERIKGIKTLLNLPENIQPLSLIAIGDPNEKKPPSDRYDPNKIHYNKW